MYAVRITHVVRDECTLSLDQRGQDTTFVETVTSALGYGPAFAEAYARIAYDTAAHAANGWYTLKVTVERI